MPEPKHARDMTDEEFRTAIRDFEHRAILARGREETNTFLVRHGLGEATPPPPMPDLPKAKPFDAATEAYLRRRFPDHHDYFLSKHGLKGSGSNG